MSWAIGQREVNTALALAWELFWYWHPRGYLTEGHSWLERVVELDPESQDPTLRAHAIFGLGGMVWGMGDAPTALRYLEASALLSEEIGDRQTLAQSYLFLGMLHWGTGQRADARTFHEKTVAIAREDGFLWGLAAGRHGLATGALEDGDFERARALLEESLQTWRKIGHNWAIMLPLNTLGDVARAEGKLDEARRYYEECLQLAEEFRLRRHIPTFLHNLGHVEIAAGNLAHARSLFREAATGYWEIGDRKGVAECLIGLGSVDAAEGRYPEAVRLFGAAQSGLEAIGYRLSPTNQPGYDRAVGLTRSHLDSAAWSESWEAGRKLSLDEIAEMVGVSKASVSTDARRMEAKGFLVRTSRPGDRRDYYGIAPGGFHTMLHARIEVLERTLALCEEARRLPVKSAVVRNRLEEWTDFTVSMIDSLSKLLASWERRHSTRPPSRTRSPR